MWLIFTVMKLKLFEKFKNLGQSYGLQQLLKINLKDFIKFILLGFSFLWFSVNKKVIILLVFKNSSVILHIEKKKFFQKILRAI